MELYPEVDFICLNKLNGDVVLCCCIDVVSVSRITRSLVFKVCVLCDVCWEIILLSPVDSFVFLSKFSDKYYCHQDIT